MTAECDECVCIWKGAFPSLSLRQSDGVVARTHSDWTPFMDLCGRMYLPT